ncbi:TIGR04222 domain-containing membrane protein [Umezawaea tangerina]|uniref:Uncharacterized protein (TIGR04222 family) n=1 Tax=Umezawaea tangerina TaxID=84725 RepID=A0A2T0SC38_9PSEU|nr:TIGR04222 domain-containing membrane protein [Umezawaea tangerina]PRY30990.1 uncharacterized protein (TIGR04222 family) [Umezawaea tangerina]
MTSGTTISGRPGISAEEFGYLAGGPGRAAEVAVVRLLEGGLLRISREGVVSAVASGAAGAGTPLEAYALGAARTGRMLGDLVKSTATSEAASALRQHLVDRGLVVSDARRKTWSTVRVLCFVAFFAAIALTIVFRVHFGVAIGVAVVALLLRWFAGRMRRPVRRAGRREVGRVKVAAGDRVGMVAQMGLLGRVGQFPRMYYVWEMLGIVPSAGATLRRRKPVRNSGDTGTMYGSSCNSCSSCSSGCGADNSGCGSGSSCGSSGDSGSSCSSGSSCGSSCGGGGGD